MPGKLFALSVRVRGLAGLLDLVSGGPQPNGTRTEAQGKKETGIMRF